MPYFKDTNNNLHFLDDASFIHLLPSACVELTDEEANSIKNPPMSTVQQFALAEANFNQAVTTHINTVAQSKGYQDAVSCSSYFNDPHLPFSSNAVKFVDWRSNVWLQCYADLASIQAGKLAMPISTEAYILTLPVIAW